MKEKRKITDLEFLEAHKKVLKLIFSCDAPGLKEYAATLSDEYKK